MAQQKWSRLLVEKLHPRETVSFALEQVNQCQRFNAVVSLNPSLRDEEAAADSTSKLLYGIPVAVKDSLLTKKWKTHCGTDKLNNLESEVDAPIIAKMKQEGAIMICKTNVPPFCGDIQTFNKFYGKTSNPYDEGLTSGGSSGGSAVLASVAAVPLAIGTDMGGSVRIPSAFTGCFGIRPTLSRCAKHLLSGVDSGQVPPGLMLDKNMDESSTPQQREQILKRNVSPLSIIGALSYSVDYLDLFLRVAFGNDYKPSPPTKSLKIAVTPQLDSVKTDARVVEAMDLLASRLRDAASNQVTVTTPQLDFSALRSAYTALASPATNSVVRFLSPNVKMPFDEEAYNAALQTQQQEQDKLNKFFDEYDIWILPVAPVLPFEHNTSQQPLTIQKKDKTQDTLPYWKSIAYVSPLTVLGNPVITVPVGMAKSNLGSMVPVGVQVGMKHGRDEELIQAAKFLQQLTSQYVFPPTINAIPSKL